MNTKEIARKESPTPAVLLQEAINKGVDMNQLEKLMDLQERWEQKEAKKAFLDALSKFQTMVPVLKKTKTAKITSEKGSFSYRYADLGSITQGIKKPLNECGLSYRWEFEEKNGLMKVTCFISHRDGHTEHTSMEAGKDASGKKNDIQQKGSTQTYLQRYTLIGALGLSTADEDNDGKNHQSTGNGSDNADDAMEQWKQSINQTKTQIELTALYMQNKKVVDSNKDIQALFKQKEKQLKGSSNNSKVNMP